MSRVFFLCAVLLFLASCGGNEAPETAFSPRQIAEIIMAQQEDIPPKQVLSPDDELFWTFISERYGIGSDINITDGIIFFAGGVLAAEIAVLKLENPADTAAVGDLLNEYITRRRAVFGGYAPVQAALLGNSLVGIQGKYVALLITENPIDARRTFLSCFGQNPPPLPGESDLPPIIYAQAVPAGRAETPEGIFEPAAILQAWETADTSALSPMNARIFEKCVYILHSLVSYGMDYFQKQAAIHDWIIDWAVFDPDFLGEAPAPGASPASYNPYGLFFHQKANCFGFSYTFQLLMNMLGLESITVHGVDFTGGKHSWNLVQIDGLWYATDITWNNPVDIPRENRPDSVTRRFFNVTSETLFFYGHRWNRDSVPEATGFR